MTGLSLYPLKFAPVFKDKIWGGTKLKEIYNIESSEKLGESWVLSGYEGDESIVTNGFLSENTLSELTEIYMGDLVGDKIYQKYGLSFPLLFKLIDAADDLSIQVHPNDEVAAKRHNSFGKTEMWYVVDAEPSSKLTIGFKRDETSEDYVKAVEAGTVEKLLQTYEVKKGDVFFIPAGLVHAIGKGIVVAEIQESSDITYRIFDYNRKDDNGNERELHTELAVDVIDFSSAFKSKVEYTPKQNDSENLVDCEFFTTNLLHFNKKIIRNYVGLDSFVAYLCVEGNYSVDWKGDKINVATGEVLFIPATIDEVTLIPSSEQVSVLEVSISI